MNENPMDPASDPSPRQGPQPRETPPAAALAVQTQQARRQCVNRYLAQSLAKKDRSRAALAVINADLMAVALPIADVFARGLANPALTIDGVQKMLPVLDTYHNLTRMIERFGQLDARIAAAHKNGKRLE